jgi:GntR family transcriptional regulator
MRKERQPSTAKRKAFAESGARQALYLRVAQTLKDEILKGIYPVGSQLPTEEELCERFSVSRYTVREAVKRLREDHLVSSRQGAGTTVIPCDHAGADTHQVTSINDLVTFAVDLRFDIDTITMLTADAKLACRIGGTVGDRWLVARGFRRTAHTPLPVCWSEVFINGEFAAVGRLLPRNRGPIFHLIEDLCGQRVTEVHQEISADIVPPSLISGFKVKSGAMALAVQRTYRLASGRIALVAINTHPAERFRHAMTMRRVKG